MDDYAQDLRKQLIWAYPSAQQGMSEAASMGHSVLAYQFVAGLCPDIKMKVAGTEGSLVSAHFEKANIEDLVVPKLESVLKMSFIGPSQQTKGAWPHKP